MDEGIRQGLLTGRRLLREGDVKGALREWKEALQGAYETQSYAAAFVLSKNVGDATLEARSGLADAVGYYDYALELLRTCNLDEEYSHHQALVDAVRYIRRRRRRARRLLEESAESEEDALTSTCEVREKESRARGGSEPEEERIELRSNEEEVCTTCEQRGTTGNPIVVDEADGCYYCQSCFDDYYAQANDPVKGTADQDTAEEHCTKPVDEGADLSTFMESSLVLVPHHEDEEQLNDETETISRQVVEEEEIPASSQDDNVHIIGSPMEVQETNSNKRVYTIDQLKSLNRTDLPCPPDLKVCVVSQANAPYNTDKSQRTTPKSRSHQKDKNIKRNGNSSQSSTETTSTASLLPTLADCISLEASMSSQPPSPIELARSLFDVVPGAVPFDSQLQIFSETS